MGSRVRIRLFHILHFVMDFLFLLLKNSKSGVDDLGHRLRSGSPVTNLPGAAPCPWTSCADLFLVSYTFNWQSINDDNLH